MLEIIGDSRAVARAAIQLAMTATREEETELKASLTEKDIVGAASDFGGTFVDSMMKMIERAVVAAKREGVSFLLYTAEDKKRVREIIRYTQSDVSEVKICGGKLVPVSPNPWKTSGITIMYSN